MEAGHKWRQFFAAGSANLAVLSIGFCMGWTSPTLPKLTSPENTPLDDVLTDDEASWIASLITLGAAVSPLYSGISTDIFGRRTTLLASGFPIIVGWILVATAKNFVQLYVARILWGLALGQIFTCVPMYVGEISEDNVRGALGSFLQIFLVIGFLLVFAVGPYVSYLALSLIGMIPPILFMVIFFFIPESPSFLVKKGRDNDAILALERLRGKSKEGIIEEFEILRAQQNQSYEKKSSIWMRGNIKSIYLTCGLVSIQQLCGINPVLFYLETIFAKTGTSLQPEISTIIIGVVQVVASSVTPFVVDRLGRKVLLIISATGMTISLGLLGMYFILDYHGNPAVDSLSWLPITVLVIYISAFCTGFGPLGWAVIGELLHPDIKYLGSTLATMLAWILSFLVTKYFGAIEDAIGTHFVFWIFGMFTFIGIFFVIFLLPETKNKSLQEIQDILNNRSPKVV